MLQVSTDPNSIMLLFPVGLGTRGVNRTEGQEAAQQSAHNRTPLTYTTAGRGLPSFFSQPGNVKWLDV